MTVSVERRASARIDKIFRVLISTEEFGEQWYVARNISENGMFVEMHDPLPLRTKVIVRFKADGDEDAAICVIGRVQNHYFFQYAGGEPGAIRALSGVGLRFLRFVPEVGGPVADDRLH
jgi:uncharacterized protein (DUF736 family)